MDCNETWHEYSSCEWALLTSFSRSKVKGQGHGQINQSMMAEAYNSTVCRRGHTFFFVFFLPLKYIVNYVQKMLTSF